MKTLKQQKKKKERTMKKEKKGARSTTTTKTMKTMTTERVQANSEASNFTIMFIPSSSFSFAGSGVPVVDARRDPSRGQRPSL